MQTYTVRTTSPPDMQSVVYRWDVLWGRTRRQIADDYIASGEAKRRKDGGWDRRYRASRFVADVEEGKPSIFA